MGTLGIRLVTVARALASRARPAPRSDAPVRRLLVAHNLLLGDTVLLAPLLKRLETSYAHAERVVLARPAFAPLFEGRPYGFRCVPFDRRDPASRRDVLASGPYDLAIVPDDNRYAWLARAAGARRVIAFADDRPAWKNWMVDRALDYAREPHAWADMATMLASGDADVAPFAAGEWPAPATADVTRPARPYAVLHVGASTPLKRWQPARWRALADALIERGLAVVWSAGPREEDVVREIGVRDGEMDLAGRLDLPQLWRLLADARLLVAPDSGVAHLGRIVGVPTAALFGPGSRVVHGPGEFWRDAPVASVTADDFPCRDQRTLYRREIAWVRRCGRRFDAGAEPAGRSDPGACGRALCMEAIGVEAVVSAADGLLADSRLNAPRSPSPPS